MCIFALIKSLIEALNSQGLYATSVCLLTQLSYPAYPRIWRVSSLFN